MKSYKDLEKKLGVTFSDADLIKEALNIVHMVMNTIVHLMNV